MNWHPFNDGKSIGEQGSERGIIVRDDDDSQGARITLERGGTTAPFAITCGIYGWMVHTRFFGTELKAESEFETMQAELSRIISIIPLAADPEADSKLRPVFEALSQ